MAKKIIKLTPVCHYCGKLSVLATGKDIYPHRKDLYSLTFFQCKSCDSYVGTHKGTNNIPLGRLANAELRKAKSYAHIHFDQLWKSKKMKRGDAYKWLADSLGIIADDCHIGMFDVETCKRVAFISMKKMRELQNG